MRRNVVFIRHSLTLPAAEGQHDKERTLSPAGIELARKRGECFDRPFGVGIVSNRGRTLETLELVGGKDIPNVYAFDELFETVTPEDEKLLDAVYNRLGKVPLSEYYEQHIPEINALRRFAERGWKTILGAIAQEDADDILVVNHAVYGPAIIHAACSHNRELADRALAMWWNECEGVELVLDDEKVVKIIDLPKIAA